MNNRVAINDTPVISIITVCLNEPNLERTCESIVNQTFQNFEWIVIDGGSNAETLAVFEKYKSRMNYFVSEPDGGIYFGMNKGIRQAHGEWLNFMNAGDHFVNSEIMSLIFNDIKKNLHYDVIYGDYVANNSDTIVKSPNANKKDLYFKTYCQQSVFIRDAIFKEFTFNTQYKICADWDFVYKIFAANYKFKRIDAIISRFYENGISRTNPKALFEELTRVRTQYYSHDEISVLKKEQALLLRKRMQHV